MNDDEMMVMMEHTLALRENTEAMNQHTLALKEHSAACNRLANAIDGSTGLTSAITALVGTFSVETIDTMKNLSQAMDYYKNYEAFARMKALADALYER